MLYVFGEQRSYRVEARSRSSAEDERASEASSRQGGPCRSELKAIGLAGLAIGPLCTFQGAEGG